MGLNGAVLFFLLECFISTFANECERIDYSKYVRKTSTTLYEDVRGRNKIDHEGCEPHQIWAFVRHGIRNNYAASSKRTKELSLEFQPKIIEAFERGHGKLCPEDVEELRSWHFDDLVTHEPHLLTSNARVEIHKMASRMKDTFPTLLNKTYDPERFYFGYGNTQRTVATFQSFAEALFEHDENFHSYKVGHYDDAAGIDCNIHILTTYEEFYEAFAPSAVFAKETGLFEKIIENMANRTGLQKIYFNEKVVRTFYEACTYESARNSIISPWCRIFNVDDLKWMGYREEFLHYNHASYGSKYIDKGGCIQMKSLISRLDRSVQDKSNKIVFSAFFSHDAVLQQLISKLGCFKDPVPINTHPSLFEQNRKWHQSVIAPFQGNVLAVLYRCNDESEEFRLQFYLNENPIGCCMSNSTKSCSWNMFRETMIDFVNNCKEDYCDEEPKKDIKSLASSFNYNLIAVLSVMIFSKYFPKNL